MYNWILYNNHNNGLDLYSTFQETQSTLHWTHNFYMMKLYFEPSDITIKQSVLCIQFKISFVVQSLLLFLFACNIMQYQLNCWIFLTGLSGVILRIFLKLTHLSQLPLWYFHGKCDLTFVISKGLINAAAWELSLCHGEQQFSSCCVIFFDTFHFNAHQPISSSLHQTQETSKTDHYGQLSYTVRAILSSFNI